VNPEFDLRRWFLSRVITVAAGTLALVSAGPSIASVTIKDLVELTDVDGLSVSPDGRFAVFRTERADTGRNSYVLRWYSVDLAHGEVRDIGSGGDPVYADPGLLQPEKALWTADGRTIVVRALRDGVVGLWQADVGGHGMVPLVTGDADVLDYSIGPDRRSVLYETGATRDQIRRAEQREYDDGILVDSTVDLSQNLIRGGSINGRMSTQRLVGYWWVRDGLLWRAPRQQHRVEVATRADAPVGPPQPVPPFDLAKYLHPQSVSNDQGEVASIHEDGARQSISVTFKDGRRVSCTDALCASSRISSLAWRPGTHDLIVTFKDRQFRQSLYLWNLDSNSLRLVAANDGLLSGGRNDFLPCAASEAAAICVSAGPASPPRVEKIDLATGERTILFDPNAELRNAYAAKVSFIHWSIGGGLEAGGVLMEPAQSYPRPAPLYLNYNRCEGFLRGGEGNEWPIPQLLEAGYAVACINAVPLSGPQDGVRNYEIALKAVRALVDRLSGEGIVDRSRIAMGGLSFGSEAAFWVAMHAHLLAALSVSSEQTDPSSYWFGAMPGSDIPATRLKVWGYGKPDETPARWRVVSPALNADKIRIPVLLQLPEQEARAVPELYARLYEEGAPTELYAFPDEAHIKIQPRHRFAVYERNLDWFRYWLEDYRDPDPVKADQYRRWDALRVRWESSRPSARSEATAPAPPSR
jgi:dipeptidyl aminopeptidase/acylaminoacyl peptidase